VPLQTLKQDDAEVETNAAIANVVKSMSATVVALGKNRAYIPPPVGDPSAALFAGLQIKIKTL
jgi:uncharacterized membrane protein